MECKGTQNFKLAKELNVLVKLVFLVLTEVLFTQLDFNRQFCYETRCNPASGVDSAYGQPQYGLINTITSGPLLAIPPQPRNFHTNKNTRTRLDMEEDSSKFPLHDAARQGNGGPRHLLTGFKGHVLTTVVVALALELVKVCNLSLLGRLLR